MKFFFSICLLVSLSYAAQSQVLISLLLGDKLNSDKLEFGLIGGVQSSTLSNVDGAKLNHTFHLGFYFDFFMNEKFSFHPAVLVKSTTGVKFTNENPLVSGIVDLDSVLMGSTVERRMSYFQVPLLMKYNVVPRFHLLLGPQAGLRTKVYDEYSSTVAGNELLYKEEISDSFKRLDAGFTVGMGYKLKPKNGMSCGIRYYYGLTDILKDNPGGNQSNRDIYFYVTVPIGKGKAPKAEVSN